MSAMQADSKNPQLKTKDLEELKCWLGTQEHLPPISEEHLIMFLHSCYYDVARTMDCIETYYTIRTNIPEIFTNRDLKRIENQKMLAVLNYIQLPVRDPNGHHIIFHSLKENEPSKYCFSDAARIYFMMADMCIQRDSTSPGTIIVFDAKGFKFGHIIRLNLSLVHKILTYVQFLLDALQEGLPVRLKGIHVLNTAAFVDHLMRLIKPFLSKELQKLIHFHTGNNESIYEHLPKRCLPQDFGGELPTVAELNAGFIVELQQFQDYFKEEERFRVDENKRCNKRKNRNYSLSSSH